MKHKKQFIIGWTAILFSLMFTWRKYGVLDKKGLILTFVVGVLVVGAVAAVCCMLFPKMTEWLQSNKAEQWVREHLSHRAFFLMVWLLLIVSWIPAYLAVYPGIFGYDAPIQIMQYAGVEALTAHHPVVHTMILGVIFSLGKNIWGTYNAGIALFTALQGLLVTNCVAATLTFMRRKKVPGLVLILGLVWTMVNTNLQVLSFNCTKDILFGVSFVYFILAFWKWNDSCRESEEKYLKKEFLCLLLAGLGMCLMRNQGIYIIGVLWIFTLFLHSRRLQTTVVLLAIILLSKGFALVCTSAGIESGDAREMYSIPMQQIAYVYQQSVNGQGAKLTEEQIAEIETVIPENGLLSYQKDTADPVKSTFVTEEFSKNKGAFIKLYITIGMQNPKAYIMAFHEMVQPYFNTTANQYRGLAFINAFPDYNIWNITEDSKNLTYLQDLKDSMVGLSYMNTPILGRLWLPDMSVWLMVGVMGVAIANKRKHVVLGLLPIILYFGTLLLGPVALIRYMYPILLTVPLLVGSVWMREECE